MRSLVLVAVAALALAACRSEDPYEPIDGSNDVVVDETEVDCEAEPERPACRITETEEGSKSIPSPEDF